MIYQKPELISSGAAYAAIRGVNKGSSETTDMSLDHTTASAYEADE